MTLFSGLGKKKGEMTFAFFCRFVVFGIRWTFSMSTGVAAEPAAAVAAQAPRIPNFRGGWGWLLINPNTEGIASSTELEG